MMKTFKFFALNFTLINEFNDTAGSYPSLFEAPAYQSEKRSLRP